MARKMKTTDGSYTTTHASYVLTNVAAIYPITPSSSMVKATGEWVTDGGANIFGREVQIVEMQSETGAVGAVHGSLVADALATIYIASQDLLLTALNLYKVADGQLSGIFSVSAHALADHASSIFGDHSGVYAYRQTECAMLCGSGVQEVMNLAVVAHIASIGGKVPFIGFFGGLRTSHEIQKIKIWDYKDPEETIDMDVVDAFHKHTPNPNHPYQRGSAQNPDISFQVREACNLYYDALPVIVQGCTDRVNTKISTDYKLFNYYGAANTEYTIISIGSVNDTAGETIDYMMKQEQRVDVIEVHLYRPFYVWALIDTIPDTVKAVSVLDRTKESGAIGEPLYLNVAAALKGSKFDQVKVLAGRYGLDSKNTTPARVMAVCGNITKFPFIVGIVDDVTNLSLETEAPLVTTLRGTTSYKFQGLNADGTVGANKDSTKVIGGNTDMHTQAYLDYDSRKSSGVTVSHLRFGHNPIGSTCLIHTANFIAYHNPACIRRYNMVQELVGSGAFLLNYPWDIGGLERHLPGRVRKFVADHNINFYTVDGVRIGIETGVGPAHINTIPQSAFFELTGIIPAEEANELTKTVAKATYGHKGGDIAQKNQATIDVGTKGMHEVEVPEDWKNREDEDLGYAVVTQGRKDAAGFVNSIQTRVNAQESNSLPVPAFTEYTDSPTPSGTSIYEKRGIAAKVPVWNPDNCIQCNFYAYVCPHAVICPVAMTVSKAAEAPAGVEMKDMTDMAGYKFTITISALDRTECGPCMNVCPGMKDNKVLVMKSLEANLDQQAIFDFGQSLPIKEEILAKFRENAIKGSQFGRSLLEFSDVCTGCDETPYAKLITQLFSDRMHIANTTECSSTWGDSSPSTPYTVNARRRGLVWNSSLFENNAGFGYGILLAQSAVRDGLETRVESVMANEKATYEMKATCRGWLGTFGIGTLNGTAADKLVAALDGVGYDTCRGVTKNKNFLAKKFQWVFGDDGWAYDIGFGGVDRVSTPGKDISIMVCDTGVYSSIGDQFSKATKAGAVTQFAVDSKGAKKKDLVNVAMSCGYVYVAQIYIGAGITQTVKAITETGTYPGPSLTIAYAPYVNHGIKEGMDKAQTEGKLAVKRGYWNSFHYSPVAEKKFILDFKAPKLETYQDFLKGEVHYTPLAMKNPERTAELFTHNGAEVKERYAYLEKLVTLYGND